MLRLVLLLALSPASLLKADRDVAAESTAKGSILRTRHHQSHAHQQRQKLDDLEIPDPNVQRIMDAMEGHGSFPEHHRHREDYSPELAKLIGGQHHHLNVRADRHARRYAVEEPRFQHQHASAHRPEGHASARRPDVLAETRPNHPAQTPHQFAQHQSPPLSVDDIVKEEESKSHIHLLESKSPAESPRLDPKMDEDEEDEDEELMQQKTGKKEDVIDFQSHEQQQQQQPTPPHFGSIDTNGDGFIDGIEFQNAIAKGVLH